MIFSRTYRYQSSIPADAIRGRLVGQHVKVHNLDFEISEKDKMIKIIPHAEDETDIRTLPITHVEIKGKGDKSQVVISSKMRKLDSGGPVLVLTFVFFLLIGALGFYVFTDEYMDFVYWMGGMGVVIFAIFWTRMERGYFDYVRKIRDFVKKSVA